MTASGQPGVGAAAAADLRPLTSKELAAWLVTSTADYADDLEAAGLSRAAAERKASESTAREFPHGIPAPGQHVYAVTVSDEHVGVLWLAAGPVDDPDNWWILDILIFEAFRGRGHGRLAMLLAETEAARLGAAKLTLNVFARNTAARALYASLAYEPTKIYLEKTLTPREP
ncbi:GNAT family N-acetyltransferase [Cryobacterium arcticum]|uniref:GNAT family acetyltransferase n=1 Tax=Cryobacterium arcticum TaxID=670052 RepID=A0A1B1BGT9_9MICO|nr:GNAT family N-acetyltransferase [Cryobacterium arcticum]ANP71787.1 GNAT family acetyltransferase [Cryobacterium arcticum]